MKKIRKSTKILILIIGALVALMLFEYFNDVSKWNENVIYTAIFNKNYPEHARELIKLNPTGYFWEKINNGILSYIYIILPLIMLIPGVYSMYTFIKSGIFKDIALRKKYKIFFSRELIYSYLPTLIVPIILGFLLFLGYLYTGKHEITADSSFSSYYLGNGFLLYFFMILNLCLVSIFFINVGLLVNLKTKNFALTVVFSILIITAYQIISEVFIGLAMVSIFDNVIFANVFSIYNLWHYDGGVTPIMAFAHVSILSIISTSLVIYKYKNLSKVVAEYEK